MSFSTFMQVEGIEGESTDSSHKNWIELLSYSFGASQSIGSAVSTGARSSGRVDMQDFSIMKDLDKSSPKLFLYCCNGTPITKITVQVTRADKTDQTYMEYVLENVLITSVQPSGQMGGNLPTESVTFNPAKITLTYTQTNHDTGSAEGNVTANWDQSLNSGG